MSEFTKKGGPADRNITLILLIFSSLSSILDASPNDALRYFQANLANSLLIFDLKQELERVRRHP